MTKVLDSIVLFFILEVPLIFIVVLTQYYTIYLFLAPAPSYSNAIDFFLYPKSTDLVTMIKKQSDSIPNIYFHLPLSDQPETTNDVVIQFKSSLICNSYFFGQNFIIKSLKHTTKLRELYNEQLTYPVVC